MFAASGENHFPRIEGGVSEGGVYFVAVIQCLTLALAMST